MMKILLVNDYNVSLGGIEQYIKDVCVLLHSEGYQIVTTGLKLPASILRRIRSLLLPLVFCNMIFSLQIIYAVIYNKPSLIWWNSVTRYIGWLPLIIIRLFHVRSWMMYHDMGYFHPYPSKLYTLDQVPKHRTLHEWLLSGYEVVGKTFITTLLIGAKYLSNSLIKKAVKISIEKHLVPSQFMADILHQQRGIGYDDIIVLPHFGRIEKN